MKKNVKKLVCLCLVSLLTLSLMAGCSAKDDNNTSDEGSTNSQEETDSTSTNGDKETFLIGGLGPISGPNAAYGMSVKQGAEVAIAEINEAGGVIVGDKTYELSLNFADDEASGETAMAAYNSLMDAGVNAILGTVTSGAGLAIVDQIAEDGILMITPSGSAQGLTEYSNAFRLCFTDPLQGETMAKFAVEELGHKKIAIIYNNSEEYSTGVMQTFVNEVEALGGEIVASEAFVTDNVDFNTQLTKIKGTDAEIIFVPAYAQDIAYITTQAADLGMNIPFIGSDGWDGVVSKVVDTSVLEGAIFLSPFLATDENPAVQSFVQTYETKYGSVPDQFAADGYDTVYVMKAAMEAAGSIESEALIAAMTSIEVSGLTGNVSFTAEGEPNKGAKFIEIVNGEYTARAAE